jgi:hypothetical protein
MATQVSQYITSEITKGTIDEQLELFNTLMELFKSPGGKETINALISLINNIVGGAADIIGVFNKIIELILLLSNNEDQTNRPPPPPVNQPPRLAGLSIIDVIGSIF